MERSKLEIIGHSMVEKICSNNCVVMEKADKDVLISVCVEAIVMGYQLGYGEMLESVTKNLNSLKEVPDDENKS